MRKNVGTLDAMLRLIFGFTGLAWGTARMLRFPHRVMPLVVTMLSAMKVAEGLTRWCPMLSVLGFSTRDSDKRKRRQRIAKYARRFEGNYD
ncbi:hypothetical protein BSNK01_16010 [Bacillaceae bacterium]